MSSLEKLAIRGIRSFDSQDLAVMQFYSPLTVIVGANGSGKTTIIECLKYATTGDLPPNTKGGAFVHDPSIAGTAEVKASVKLRFHNSKKQKMMVERRLQVTKKKTGTGLTMKTLEGTISFSEDQDIDAKQRKTLSTKCAALDEEVPKQLGVSKAILENVIFCHQEESNWPLSEPAPLKKKFDDIFEATKYTKALDAIKTLRKTQTADNKVAKERLAALKIDKERSKKLTAKMTILSQEIDLKKIQIESLSKDIGERRETNRNFYNTGLRYQETINKAATLDKQKDIIQKNLLQLEESITKLTETDSALQHAATSSGEASAQLKKDRHIATEKLQDEMDALTAAERKKTESVSKEGGLKAKKERYERTLQERQILIQRLAHEQQIPGFDHDLSIQEIADFSERLEELVRSQRLKIETIKAESRKIEADLQEQIHVLRNEVANAKTARSALSEHHRSLNNKATQESRKIESTLITAQDITYEEQNLEGEKTRKQAAEAALAKENYPDIIAAGEVELRTLEEKREKLLEDLNGLNKQADTRARLGLKKTDLVKKEELIQSTIEKNTPKYRKFVGVEPVKDSMDREVDSKILENEIELDTAETSASKATRALQSIETSLSLAKTKIKTLNTTAADVNKRLREGKLTLDEDTQAIGVAEGIAEAEMELAAIEKEAVSTQGDRNFYKQVLEEGKVKKSCIGCNRGLAAADMKEFQAWCNKKLSPQKDTLELEQETKEWQKTLRTLKALLPLQVSADRLREVEIPEAENAAKALEQTLPAVVTAADLAAKEVRELKDKSRDLQLLRRAATDVLRMVRECEELKRSITSLELELRDTGSIETSEDVQMKLSEVANNIKSTKTSIEQARTTFSTQSRAIQRFISSIHESELRLSTKRQELLNREALENQLNQTREEMKKAEADKLVLDERLRKGATPLRIEEDKLIQARSDAALKEQQATLIFSSLTTSKATYDENNREIKKYTNEGTAQRLDATREDIKKSEATIAKIKLSITTYQREISQADRTESEFKSTLRNVKDNIRFREEQAALKTMKDSISDLGVEEARKAAESFAIKYQEFEAIVTKLQAKKAKLEGETSAQEVNLRGFETEQKTEYADIEARHTKEEVNVKTVEGASQDLEKYGKALDSAIMSFHGHKMQEINSTLKDLWVKTYQGTDIDSISIKSDAEGKTNGARSYNYRVVMAKDNVEMDMRGRCSAGQKVLASIIIRLALAESFSANCGILALDEPTTNLDKENIDALSRSLADIIKERRGQSNFQLIVITHDESFLEILGGQGVLDRYWRVSRANDGKKSTIERQKLT